MDGILGHSEGSTSIKKEAGQGDSDKMVLVPLAMLVQNREMYMNMLAIAKQQTSSNQRKKKVLVQASFSLRPRIFQDRRFLTSLFPSFRLLVDRKHL